ncbi:MAG TPA: hypothetical protein PKO43_00585 [Bacilli bacterium]|nr:hypothetical protein [Bacilli bacterium]HQD92445.1 hypothetical protein [Bacilli bacterium]
MKRLLGIRVLTIFLIVLLALVYFVRQSFAYFDHLQTHDNQVVAIGDWQTLTKEKVIDYLSKNIPNIYHRFILDSLGKYSKDIDSIKDLDELYDAFILSEKYCNYSIKDFWKIVDETYEMASNFLIIPSNDNLAKIVPYYPTNNGSVNFQIINEFSYLEPGQSKQVVKVINSANLSNINNHYDPMIIQVVMESKNPNQDISDYLLEVFIDSTFLVKFDTGYIIFTDSSLNYPFISKSQFKLENLEQYTINNSQITSTVKVQLNYSSPFITYNYTYSSPQTSGRWMRLPQAFQYEIAAERYNPWGYIHRQTGTQDGLMLVGRPDGVHTDMRILFAHRYISSDVRTVNIPLAFVLSRANGDPVNETEIIVKYRVVMSSSSHYWDPNLFI